MLCVPKTTSTQGALRTMTSRSFWARQPPTAICMPGPGCLDRRQVAQVAVELVVGVLADRAGVEDDDVRRLVAGRPHVARGLEQAREPLGVVDVHLAAERAHLVGPGACAWPRRSRQLVVVMALPGYVRSGRDGADQSLLRGHAGPSGGAPGAGSFSGRSAGSRCARARAPCWGTSPRPPGPRRPGSGSTGSGGPRLHCPSDWPGVLIQRKASASGLPVPRRRAQAEAAAGRVAPHLGVAGHGPGPAQGPCPLRLVSMTKCVRSGRRPRGSRRTTRR